MCFKSSSIRVHSVCDELESDLVSWSYFKTPTDFGDCCFPLYSGRGLVVVGKKQTILASKVKKADESINEGEKEIGQTRPIQGFRLDSTERLGLVVCAACLLIWIQRFGSDWLSLASS